MSNFKKYLEAAKNSIDAAKAAKALGSGDGPAIQNGDDKKNKMGTTKEKLIKIAADIKDGKADDKETKKVVGEEK